MEILIYNSTSILRVIFSQYGKAFGLPATSVALVVPGVNTPDDNHWFKSLFYTKTLVKWIIPYLISLFKFIAVAFRIKDWT